MRFRDRRPAPFMTRSDRSRLMRLFVALGLIVVGIKVAADPATWVWMFPEDTEDQTAATSLADVTYDVALDDKSLRSDEFRSEPNEPQPVAVAADAVTAEPHWVSPETLAGVEDDTLSLRKSDQAAYDALLERLRTSDEQMLAAAFDASATFPAVMTEPGHFRGRVVSLNGIARRILEMPASANSQDGNGLYELWVFTPDSGENPWRVVATDLPNDLPRGLLEDGVPVRVNGVFFKRQGYETQRHALHVAPLLLAKTVHRVRPPGRAIAEFNPTPWLVGAAAAVTALFVFMFLRFRREDRAFQRTTLARFTAATPEAVAAIPAREADDPGAFFRELEAAESSNRDTKHS